MAALQSSAIHGKAFKEHGKGKPRLTPTLQTKTPSRGTALYEETRKTDQAA
jgi:hypothetical protein